MIIPEWGLLEHISWQKQVLNQVLQPRSNTYRAGRQEKGAVCEKGQWWDWTCSEAVGLARCSRASWEEVTREKAMGVGSRACEAKGSWEISELLQAPD